MQNFLFNSKQFQLKITFIIHIYNKIIYNQIIILHNSHYKHSQAFTFMANSHPKHSKLVAFLAQQVSFIAQKVPLVVTIGPLIYLGRFY